MDIILTLAFCVAFVTSLIVTALALRVAPRIGFVDRPGGRKVHERAVPFGGGVAIVLATCLVVGAAAAGAALSARAPGLLPIPPALSEDITRAAARVPLLLYILGGGLLIALFGLWDDIRPRSPAAKFTAQFLVAVVVVAASGLRISLNPFLERLHQSEIRDLLQAAVTVLWIVLLTNSFNLLDNMDGLSSTVSFICAGALLILAVQTGQFLIAGFLLALMGAILGFLYFNFPPAGIFMGDMGAMFIGYMLATISVLTTFVNREQFNPLFPVLVPLIIFAVPIYDALSVVAIRMHHRRPIMKGDRNHFSHRMRRLGMNGRRVLLTIALVTLATSLGATVPYGPPSWQVVIPAVQAICVMCVIMQLELVSVQIECLEPESKQAPARDSSEPRSGEDARPPGPHH